jgi:hypothetical protein
MAHDEGMAGIRPRLAGRKIYRRVAATAGAEDCVGDRADFTDNASAFAQDRDV